MSTRHHSVFGRRSRSSALQAFTLIELLVVVAIIGLLISILLPGLRSAREQARLVVCGTNARSLAQGVITYSTEAGTLPGHLHPAVYRQQGLEAILNDEFRNLSEATARYYQSRQLTFKLRRMFQDSQSTNNSITDQVATCPTLAGILSDNNFNDSIKAAGNAYYNAFPTHYTINNWGSTDPDSAGPVGNQRATSPALYFGYSPNTPNDTAQQALAEKFPAQPLEKIARQSEEWMIAEAWFRPRSSSVPELQQEGPYQSAWTGQFLPNFAPHGNKVGGYTYNPAGRNASSQEISASKADGRTNTAFFDGHVDAVRSRELRNQGFGGSTILYGFPGTVNYVFKNKNLKRENFVWF